MFASAIQPFIDIRREHLGRSAGRMLLTDTGLAVLLTAALLPFTVDSLWQVRQSPGWGLTVLAAVALLHASVAVNRLACRMAYGMACLAMTVIMLAPFGQIERPTPGGPTEYPMLLLPSCLLFLLPLYSLCARSNRRVAAAAFLIAASGVALAAMRAGQVLPVDSRPWQVRAYCGALAILLAVSAAWGLGRSRMEMAGRAAAQRAEETRRAVLAERSRIARDMHDVVSHSLAVIVRQAEGGALVAVRTPDRAETVLRTIADVGREALDDMRGMLGVLRDPGPAGLRTTQVATVAQVATVPAALNDLPVILDRVGDAGLPVELTERGRRHDLGKSVELAVHYLIQEALTNVIKHAGPGARAQVILDWRPEALVIEIVDDGGGGPAASAVPVPGAGIGLCGLRERICAVDGQLTAGPREVGFGVRAVLPRRGGKGAS